MAAGILLCGRVRLFRARRWNAISGRFSGDLSRVRRSRMAADAPGRPRHSSRPASMPAGPANPASGPGIASPPGRPRHGQHGTEDHPRLLPAICRGTTGISGHDRPLGPIGGFRYARATMAHIGPEQGQEYAPYGDRNRRGGLMILVCLVAHVTGALRRGFLAPDNLLILSIVPGWA
jgi:hypothetical protein